MTLVPDDRAAGGPSLTLTGDGGYGGTVEFEIEADGALRIGSGNDCGDGVDVRLHRSAVFAIAAWARSVVSEMAPRQLADLPALGYDELTVAITALASQANNDRDNLAIAQAAPNRALLAERRAVSLSLITAAAEARARVIRPEGGPLEPLRVAWEEPSALAQSWIGS